MELPKHHPNMRLGAWVPFGAKEKALLVAERGPPWLIKKPAPGIRPEPTFEVSSVVRVEY